MWLEKRTCSSKTVQRIRNLPDAIWCILLPSSRTVLEVNCRTVRITLVRRELKTRLDL